MSLATTDLGHVWLLPATCRPTVPCFIQEILNPMLEQVLIIQCFYGVDEGDVAGMEYEDAFGFSFQVGLDYNLNDKWFLNLDVKKLLLSTDVEVDTGAGVLPVEVDINPLMVGLGIGRRF